MAQNLRIANPNLENQTRASIEAIVERRLARQVQRAYERIPFYRDRWPAKAASIGSYDDFRRLIPFTQKADFLDSSVQGNRTATPGSRVFSFHMTSGTTGLGQEVHPLTYLDHEALASSWLYQLGWAGVEPGDRIFFTFPVGFQTGGLQSTSVTTKFGLTAFQLGPYGTEDKVDYMLRFDANALVIAPAFLTRITAVMEGRGLRPGDALPNLKAIFTAGESYTLEWAERMQDLWGVTIHEWYGLMQGGTGTAVTCEGGIAPGGRRGALHCLEQRMLCEILDPETDDPVAPGESGELVITSLFREAFPVVRFRTGDRVKLLDGCPCGRPLKAIEAGTVSRYDDMMKIRGQNLWPSTVDAVVFADDHVEEYAGRVSYADDGREDVEVAVEFKPSANLTEAERTEALRRIAENIKRRANVTMRLREAPYMSLPRFEFKVRRWTDERRENRKVVRYTRSD